jgi:hypothetical protein
LDSIFGSIFESGVSVGSFFLCMGVALVTGFLFAWANYFHSRSSKSFLVTTALLPAAVAMVIMLVNGNIGIGVTVAGAFALVRFRSAAGSAKEICTIFIAMVCGLAFGVGYLAYGVLFAVIAGIILFVLAKTNIWERKTEEREKKLSITIPEELDYANVFEDLFGKYTESHSLLKVKTINMGSMFRATYSVKLKEGVSEKQFVDELRCRNGNLEIVLSHVETAESDL